MSLSPTISTVQPGAATRGWARTWFTVSALALFTLLAYAAACENAFAFDDDVYVTTNEHLRSGWSNEAIAWAFRSGYASNWHPLTWLSHLADVTWYGLEPAGHHLTSLLLHVANTLLLFWVLRALSTAHWRSALVAALFALHPLHVESVAWISERKDVLSTFFWFMTSAAYVAYVRRPGSTRYFLVLACFTLGLLAKQMLVTLPFTLLLLDVWPLQRLSFTWPARFGPEWRARVREKLPLFLLAIAGSVATFVAQSHAGAVGDLTRFPLMLRLGNAVSAYGVYLWKLFVPVDLAIFYPYPSSLDLPLVAGVLFLLACISFVVLRQSGRRPYLAVGWFFYLGTLVPVIGLVQIGEQAHADRYTYIPSIGLFVAIVWLSHDLVQQRPALRRALTATWLGILALLCLATFAQVRHWKNDESLFRHALAVTERNYLAHDNLGFALVAGPRAEEAVAQFQAALAIRPDYAISHNNLGRALLSQGDFVNAAEHLQRATAISPDVPSFALNLSFALSGLGRLDEAQQAFAGAQRMDPDSQTMAGGLAPTLARFGALLVRQGSAAAAAPLLQAAVQLSADMPDAQLSLAHALLATGDAIGAEAHYRRVIELKPDPAARFFAYGNEVLPQAYLGLARTLAARGELYVAASNYRQALTLAPGSTEAAIALAWLLATADREDLFLPGEAFTIATICSRRSAGRDPLALDVLAAACAGRADFAAAVRFAQFAEDAARQQKLEPLAERIGERRRRYAAGQGLRQTKIPLEP